MADVTISDAEWLVMQSVWKRGRATAAEVIADLAESTQWRHRTIRTLLARLVDKGALAATDEGGRYLYRPLVSRQRSVRAEGRQFLKRVFAGDAGELLVHFVRDSRITPEEIEKLRRLLDAKRTDNS